MNIYLKVVCYAALMGVWGVFAFCGKTDVGGFIEAIGAALAALGAIHAVASNKAQPPAANGPAPTQVVSE
ncbi:hypothetical protein G3N95_30210 [Paraburkholderia sp. Tr-20389]|uniref:hypothetical protein n=1 Tax=Paraburkholderia sp. Tr-20389 TaxID=2703903 RepID=UPI00198035B6|nr:hypothetical protein [Paraburkholderia sp. Tr-20389]MBN3757250.1 hypothetical protein [Paraburkholderia sp. Tr-20389]